MCIQDFGVYHQGMRRMTILRTDIERGLDELISQEEGMRFQGLAVALGKNRWPELTARQRKKDLGLDAYIPASLTHDRIGKGLAASITPTLKKISDDVETAKKHFQDLGMLLFVTPAKIGNAYRKLWEETISEKYGVVLHIIEREDIIIEMLRPENKSLLPSFLNIYVDNEPSITDLNVRTKKAASNTVQRWLEKTKGISLIDLSAVRLEANGTESTDVMSLEHIGLLLSQCTCLFLEAPAGGGKTTTLAQLALRMLNCTTPFIIELSAWMSSGRSIFDYIACNPSFLAERLTASDLARVQQVEPFVFLLNGWNEVAESHVSQVNSAVRELQRDFPNTGIIITTRTHHLMPPLSGAVRLKLLRIQPAQRASYIESRLGQLYSVFKHRINIDPVLDDLTRTPLVLSEVASLLEAGIEIPSTKNGIVEKVLQLHEQMNEHRNALQTAPIFGEHVEYLKALAFEMTRCGNVILSENDARGVVAAVSRALTERGRIEQVAAPRVLATLAAHHVLEHIEYPHKAYRFGHQQLQEHYAAKELHSRIFDFQSNSESYTNFIDDYINVSKWAEPLRMLAAMFSEPAGDSELTQKNTYAGRALVEMALEVDVVFAAELSQLCGPVIWGEVRGSVNHGIRAVYDSHNGSFRQYAIAAMLATGKTDFSDILLPLLSAEDQQTRLSTYRLWPDIQAVSVGENWSELVQNWREEARQDFVSEILHHRFDSKVATFAAEDRSIAVKKAAVSGLIWTGSDDALIPILESMDEQAFDEVGREYAERMPSVFRTRIIAAIRKVVDTTEDNYARLRNLLYLIELAETVEDGVVKNVLSAIKRENLRDLEFNYIKPALELLHQTDPVWVGEWVAMQMAEGALYERELWFSFLTDLPEEVSEKYIQLLETKDPDGGSCNSLIAVIAALTDTKLAERMFKRLCELQRDVESKGTKSKTMHRIESVFNRLPCDITMTGIISSQISDNLPDIKATTSLLSNIFNSNARGLNIADNALKASLRDYLKNSIDIILRIEDFSGEEKANLASAIALIGKPEDLIDLIRLLRADIERVRRGRAARAAGDHGPLGNSGAISCARRHINALTHIDSPNTIQALIDLLPEPEYCVEVAEAMACDFALKPENPFAQAFHYDLIWEARAQQAKRTSDNHRYSKFKTALCTEISRRIELNDEGKHIAGLKELAKALSAIDGYGSAKVILDVISTPGMWDHYICLETAERLLMSGVIFPTAVAFTLIDSVLDRITRWKQNGDERLLTRAMIICLFVETPEVGVAKIREVLDQRRLIGHELRELIVALGESKSDSAVTLLYDLACDSKIFRQFEQYFINSFAILDTQHARELLLSFVDSDIKGFEPQYRLQRHDALVFRLKELTKGRAEILSRLIDLCQRDLPEPNRQILSKVMASIETFEAQQANLYLINDARDIPVPQGILDQFKSAFIERRPYEQSSGMFTLHSRQSNELRALLFRIAVKDKKRQKSAYKLLGQIECWRLEFGRPIDEQRHPDLKSGLSWPC